MSGKEFLSLNKIVENFQECKKDYSTVRTQLIELLNAVGVDINLYKTGGDDKYYFTEKQAKSIEELMDIFSRTLKIRQGSYEGVELAVSASFDKCIKTLIETLSDETLKNKVEKRLLTMEMYYVNYHLSSEVIEVLRRVEEMIEHPEVLRLFKQTTQKFYDEYKILKQALDEYSDQVEKNEKRWLFNLSNSSYDPDTIGMMIQPKPPVFMDIYNNLRRKH